MIHWLLGWHCTVIPWGSEQVLVHNSGKCPCLSSEHTKDMSMHNLFFMSQKLVIVPWNQCMMFHFLNAFDEGFLLRPLYWQKLILSKVHSSHVLMQSDQNLEWFELSVGWGLSVKNSAEMSTIIGCGDSVHFYNVTWDEFTIMAHIINALFSFSSPNPPFYLQTNDNFMGNFIRPGGREGC